MSGEFGKALVDVFSSHAGLRPPNRVPISQGVADTMVIKTPGRGTMKWSAAEACYMVEPLDTLGSRRHEGLVFGGPAQSGKTAALVEGWAAHNIANDPGDMLIVQMTQDKAREYSRSRIDRMLDNSPRLLELRGGAARDDNMHDKWFKHGMQLRIGWPTPSNTASTNYRYVISTDYDRVDDDIGGEGDLWGVMSPRTRTFMSRGMCAAESSPGRDIEDPTWSLPFKGSHEAPPCKGVLGLYNRGDRRRWYWRCPDCAGPFEAEPGLGLFKLPEFDQLLQDIRSIDIGRFARDYARVVCPHCGAMQPETRKTAMNAGGRWLREGAIWLPNGQVDETAARESSIASFWLGGVAAAYSTWGQLLRKYLQALLDYAQTGSEEGLKATINTDQGAPYIARRLVEAQRVTGPEERKEELPKYVLPAETRTVLAAVDVQGGRNARFVVQVHAVGYGGEQWPIDRYDIIDGLRPREGGGFMPVEPAVYAEDWDTLTERVLRSTYRVAGRDVELSPHMVAVDTGGEQRTGRDSKKGTHDEGVAHHAYAWFRRLKKDGLHVRVCLVKGVGIKGADWHYRQSMVGGKGTTEGDVPLYSLNSNKLKDEVDSALKRADASVGGFFHVPDWWTLAMFDELRAEERNRDGTWTQRRARNETFDLCYYIRALMVRLGMDKRLWWDQPPAWALPLEKNSEAITRADRVAMRENELVGYVVAPPAPASKPFKRRTGGAAL